MNAKADPPVCKVEDYAQRLVVAKTREKEVKATQKARALKEIFMTGGIEKRDFLTKMKKVNEFLTRGHPVKVTVVPKRFLKNDRFKNGVRRDRMAGKFYCASFASCFSILYVDDDILLGMRKYGSVKEHCFLANKNHFAICMT